MRTYAPPCRRCGCPADSHKYDEVGACVCCDCDNYQGPRDEPDADEPEPEIVDGPCEYERRANR